MISFLFWGATSFSWARPNHLVVGYSATWFDGLYPPESYNYGAFTHIARAFLTPKADGTIVAPGGYWDPDLEKMAHDHGVKLLASLGGASPNADNWLAMARDPKAEKAFFDSLERMITDHHYDGVDVDWEPSALTDRDQATFTLFMKALRARFPSWFISAALGASDYYGKHISWAQVARQVDLINWMAYDFGGTWSGHSVHNANLYPPKDPKVDSGMGIDQNLALFEAKYGLPAGKLVLGLPFYGVQFLTPHMGDSFSGDLRLQGAQIQFYEIAPLLADKGGYQSFWDGEAGAPYLEKLEGGFVVSYDNPESIALKCDYAVRKGLQGVMIWNLGADLVGEKTPLLDAVAKAYGAPVLPMPANGLAKSVQNMGLTLRDSFEKLQKARGRLTAAGKTAAAKEGDPGALPELTVPAGADAKALGKKLWEIQYFLNRCDRELNDCQAVLDSLPVKEVRGQKIETTGERVLIDSFEGGGTVNALGGNWTADCDHNNLGTVLNPVPYAPSAGGTAGSEKFAAHIFGHLGKSMAPWPYAELMGTLNAPGSAADLSDFKTFEFWAKGDGKYYSALLVRAAVEDYANPREDFKAPSQWTKRSLKLADFKQPNWGRPIPPKVSDILYLSFTPSAAFSDEDFDLWVDDVTLVK